MATSMILTETNGFNEQSITVVLDAYKSTYLACALRAAI